MFIVFWDIEGWGRERGRIILFGVVMKSGNVVFYFLVFWILIVVKDEVGYFKGRFWSGKDRLSSVDVFLFKRGGREVKVIGS